MEVRRNMKSNTFKEYIQPTVVLVIICLVITFALAYVNSITAPIIAENTARSQDAARAELLPAADSFEQYDGDLVVLSPDQVYVSDCYVATNGSGIVVTVESSSYGGLLTAMVGVDNSGAITGMQVTAHGDTSGLGTKAHAASYLEQYVGVTELAGADYISADPAVSAVTGATVSSNAMYQAANAALQQYQAVQGGAN